jgi:hypothetical protein
MQVDHRARYVGVLAPFVAAAQQDDFDTRLGVKHLVASANQVLVFVFGGELVANFVHGLHSSKNEYLSMLTSKYSGAISSNLHSLDLVTRDFIIATYIQFPSRR